jgi:hypothetical protein
MAALFVMIKPNENKTQSLPHVYDYSLGGPYNPDPALVERLGVLGGPDEPVRQRSQPLGGL